MVNPLYILGIGLGIAFLLPLFEKIDKKVPRIMTLILLLMFSLISFSWVLEILGSSDTAPMVFNTIGFKAPFSISLQVGLVEAIVLLMINMAALLSGLYHSLRQASPWAGKQIVLFLTLVVGVNGLIMTRDLFNLFVFLEIVSISMYALIASNDEKHAYEAGFKYLIAGSIASAFYLIGVIYLYRFTGTLYIDQIIAMDLTAIQAAQSGLIIAIGLIMLGLLIELKPFPANGWAIDAYEASDPAVSAMISAVGATGVVFAFYKISSLFTPEMAKLVVGSGAVTFIFSQLIGLRQKKIRRMLGYSSVGQIGLIIMIIGMHRILMPSDAMMILSAALILLGNHIFSKAGLFWLSDIFDGDQLKRIRERPLLKVLLGVFLASIAGLPPFPAFWAKWRLVTVLAGNEQLFLIFLLLVGSLFEAGYLFRWFTTMVSDQTDPGNIHEERVPEDVPVLTSQTGVVSSKRALAALEQHAESVTQEPRATVLRDSSLAKKKNPVVLLVAVISSCLVLAGGILIGSEFLRPSGELLLLLPATVLAAGLILDLLRLPHRIHLILVIAGISFYSYRILMGLDGLYLVFGVIFLIGSLVQMISLFARKSLHFGLIPMITALILSLGNLLIATTRLGFFFSWEMMTVLSFLLILRGRKASGAGLRYLLFSLGGAYSMLIGLMLYPDFSLLLQGVKEVSSPPLLAAILIAVGALVKMGSLGLHIWLPGAYAEAEDEVSSLLSSVVSKAGLFLLFVTSSLYLVPVLPTGNIPVSVLLGWIGAFTALAGAFFALFQEDIKYTLAYSSMGQLGYMLLAFSLMTHLGWVTSLYMAVTHLLFKALLFLAVAGVLYRTKTRMMYQMGGLIKRMPVSFITVLLSIIALSGVPPLTGFGGKWLLYTALIEKGWYLQAGVAMFASAIAFLYLFRLIHVIFLGQLKDEHRELKEAPIWFLIPQVVGMIVIMLFSMYPSLLIVPLQKAVTPFFTESIIWEGYTVFSTLGYWNGNAVMYVTIGVFVFPLAWLLLMQRKHTRLVKQFNIVFAAERPDRPETTHFGYNFFSHYRRALGMYLTPWATRWWTGIASLTASLGGSLRRLYTGNGQTYAFYMILYATVLLLLLRGGI